MSISDREFAAYILGDAPPALAERIQREAASDEGLAAQLAAFAPLSLPLAEASPPMPAVSAPLRTHRRSLARTALLAASILVTVGGVAWGGYEILRTRPLLEDDFNSGTIEYGKWDPRFGRKGVSAQDRYLRLLNRGSVVTRQEFDQPIEITFDWRWIDHGQWPLYSEVFTVCLHTHGAHKPEHDFGITDGLYITFNTVEHNVHSGMPERPETAQRSAPDTAPMPPDQWYHVRIVDDGHTATVFIEGPSIDPKYKREPILTASIPPDLTGRHIAFFNREYVGATNHESHVDNVRVWAVRK